MSNILDQIIVLETKGFTKSEAIEILKLDQSRIDNEKLYKLISEIFIVAPNGKRYLQVYRG